MARKVSVEKFIDILMNVPLFVMSHISFFAFEICSKSCLLKILLQHALVENLLYLNYFEVFELHEPGCSHSISKFNKFLVKYFLF